MSCARVLKKYGFLLILAVALSAFSGLAGRNSQPRAQDAPRVSFESRDLWVVTSLKTVRLRVELAGTALQRAYGLMERNHLDPNAGMLFLFQELQPPEKFFWMYRTVIPLDIAFLGPEGEIRAIQSMQPCRSINPDLCARYSAGVEFISALEVNEGFFSTHRIGVGDRVLLAPANANAKN